MTAEQYMRCTWREFVLRYQGYQIKRAHDFEHTRVLAYEIVWANIDHSKTKMPPIQKWWPLITDDEVEEEDEYTRLKKIMEQAEQNKLYN